MAQQTRAGTSGRAGDYAPRVATISAQPPSYATQIDPVEVVTPKKTTTRRPCLSKGAIIAIAVVVSVVCLGGIAAALIFTVFWNAVSGAASATTTTTQPNPLPIWGFSTTTPLLPAQCGRSFYLPIQSKVIGGSEANPHSWPWLTELAIYSKRNPTVLVGTCGGVLIADQWVLTAAHCTSNFGGVWDLDVGIEVNIGVHNKYQPNVIRQAGIIFTNPQYTNATHRNDIALLKLDYKVPFTDQIQPICLPNSGDYVAPGYNYFVAGWGSTVSGELPVAIEAHACSQDTIVHGSLKTPALDAGTNNVLVQTQLPVMSDGQCNIYDIFDSSSQLCAAWPQGQRAPCQGDSGGPLMKQQTDNSWVAVGIVSYAAGCAVAGKPDVLTDIAYYRFWVDQIIRSN